MPKFINLIFLQAQFLICFSQPEITWQECYGGTLSDGFVDAKRAYDGGYICLGSTNSDDFDLEGVCCAQGGLDFWVIKFDSNFNIEWQQQFGTILGLDVPIAIFENTDLTYSVFGITGENSGSCDCNHSSSQDLWFIKLNNSGSIISQTCYGGSSYDILNNVVKCSDGGYILGASTGSNDGDVGLHYDDAFSTDAFILKIDSLGSIEWTKTMGGSSYDAGWVTAISKNRYLINIITSSVDYDLDGLVPDGETSGRLLLILDSAGIIQKEIFDRSYNHLFELYTPYEFKDDRYIIVGRNQIDTGFFTGNLGGADAAIGLYDSNLVLLDIFQFGGSETDVFEKLIITEDTSIFFTGFSSSSDFDTQGGHGEEEDAFIVKTDTLINKIWSKTFGATLGDRIAQLFQIDSSLILVGKSSVVGVNDGDINDAHFDEDIGPNSEAWILVMNDLDLFIDTLYSNFEIKIYPNPTSDVIIIEITSLKNEPFLLDVYSIAGKKVLREEIYSNVINEISVSHLTTGYYLFCLSKNKQILEIKNIYIEN